MSAMPTETVWVERHRLVIPTVDVTGHTGGASAPRRRLGLDPLVVGSDPSADLVIVDPAVSRRHCSLALTDKGILVRDLQSKNGTYYQLARIEAIHVAAAATIQLSPQTLLTFHAVGGQPTEIRLSPDVTFGGAFGASDRMRAVFAALDRVSTTNETILLWGESGTGKEVLARAIHDRSPRRRGPFIPVDCGAISPSLIESELFGHVRGSFTGATSDRQGAFAQSHGGTLFLDEIGELPLDLQPKLLRALESREYRPVGGKSYASFDARVIAATHRDLRVAKDEGTFREDLYFRLAVFLLRVPPLRERREDITLLAERFLSELSPPRRIEDLSPAVLAMLQSHDFPGNVRELKNTVMRLALFPELVSEAFEQIGRTEGPASLLPEELFELPWLEAKDQLLAELERKFVMNRLERNQGNVSRAATSMGISRQSLHRMMNQHGIKGRTSQ